MSMDRRKFVAALPARRGTVPATVLAGCSRSADGPGKIAWDRDVCVRCSMVISERSFAAQIRQTR